MLPNKNLKELQDTFSKNNNILLVYLFGSQARGESREGSDIDLAILCEKSPSLDEHAEWVVQCQSLFKKENIDVVILNNASPLLQFEVIREGKLLYQQSSFSDDELNHFELRVIKEYFDTEHLRHVQDLYLKEKVLGVPSGF